MAGELSKTECNSTITTTTTTASSSSSSSSSPVRVMVWCPPRSTSNLFARCLTGIDGMEVWIEPYEYAKYALDEMQRKGLRKVDDDVPDVYEGNEAKFEEAAEAMGAFFRSKVVPQRLPYGVVKHSLESSKSKYVLVKDFAMAMEPERLRQYFPVGFKHTFLIRHPSLTFRSYRKALVKKMVDCGMFPSIEAADDNGFDITARFDDIAPTATDFHEANYRLWRYVRENIDPNPVVIDSSDLLRDPPGILAKFCDAVGLPYSNSLLTWESTRDSYRSWKLSGDHLLDDVESFLGALLQTTGFLPASPLPSRDQLSDDVIRATDAVLPLYNEMYATRMT